MARATVPPHWLYERGAYDVAATFTIPQSARNVEMGMFMISTNIAQKMSEKNADEVQLWRENRPVKNGASFFLFFFRFHFSFYLLKVHGSIQ